VTGRSGRHLTSVLAGGLCALGLASAIALAAPPHHTRASAGVRRCARRAGAASRRRTRASACRAARRRHGFGAAGTGTRVGAGTGVGPAPGAPAQAGASTQTPAPAGSPPGSPAEGGEGTTPAAPPSVPHVQVIAVEYHYTLSRTTVPQGKVVFQFVNNGEDEHNLNVSPGEGSVLAATPNTASKKISELSVELRPGTYTLFCSMPEHEKKGMKATLVVE
jgi:plastocyanin